MSTPWTDVWIYLKGHPNWFKGFLKSLQVRQSLRKTNLSDLCSRPDALSCDPTKHKQSKAFPKPHRYFWLWKSKSSRKTLQSINMIIYSTQTATLFEISL